MILELVEQILAGISIEIIIKGKLIILSYAISAGDYLQEMTQAGFASLSAFDLSIAGIIVGSTFFVSSMSPMICSIFFGFIGYIAARWLTGLIVIKIREKISSQDCF